jgi:glycosyltransferase involved in cell wall biosynthesis
MMKVCFYINSNDNYNPQGGGVQRITRVLFDEFTKLQVETYLLSPPSNDVREYLEYEIVLPSQDIDSIENINFVREFIKIRQIDIFINQDGFNPPSLNLLYNIKGLCKVISVHHNCILCLYAKYTEIFTANRSKLLTKIINTFNLWAIVKFLFKKRQQFLWKRMIELSDGVVLYFDSFRKELEILTGIESDKIKIIPNPAPFDIFEKGKKINKKIVYVGRVINNQKRIDRLMELWRKLHEEFPDWSFDLVGDGAYLGEAKMYADTYSLNRIHFYGMQDPIPYFDQADIFTLTSDFEGYGMVLIEAQARGTVPVSFNCFSAIGEVIENKVSGIIVNDNELSSMYFEMKKLMQNNDYLLNMREAGPSQVVKFNKSQIGLSWYRLFLSITSR